MFCQSIYKYAKIVQFGERYLDWSKIIQPMLVSTFNRATMVNCKPDYTRLCWLVLAVSGQLKARAVEIPKSQISPADTARRTLLHC